MDTQAETGAPSSEDVSLQAMTRRALSRPDGDIAIEFENRAISWSDMRLVAEKLFALMAKSGADPRAPVTLIARNRPSAIAALLALTAEGRTIRMVYPFQSGAGIARALEQRPSAIVIAAAQDFSEPVLEAARKLGMAALAIEDMDAHALPGLERAGAETETFDKPRIEILTSGTTGPPKAFPISYEMAAKDLVLPAMPSDPSADTRPPPLLIFPVGNISGLYTTLPAMLAFGRAILLDRFNARDWRDYIVRFGIEHSGMPPAGVQMVMEAGIPKDDLKSLKSLSTGAAPLDPSVHRAFEAHYGVPILLSYGATEFGGPVTMMTPALHARWGDEKFGTVGVARPGAKLRVVDPETGAELPPNTEGVLEVVSPRIGPDWIRTSDLALIDEDGFVFHKGRADCAIMRGGFKVLPETIERALMLHEAVSAAGVVGAPDKRLGQVPAAAVQLKPGASKPSFAELEAHLRDHVLAHHIPVYWLILDELPRTPSMKVDRPALNQLFKTESR